MAGQREKGEGKRRQKETRDEIRTLNFLWWRIEQTDCQQTKGQGERTKICDWLDFLKKLFRRRHDRRPLIWFHLLILKGLWSGLSNTPTNKMSGKWEEEEEEEKEEDEEDNDDEAVRDENDNTAVEG